MMLIEVSWWCRQCDAAHSLRRAAPSAKHAVNEVATAVGMLHGLHLMPVEVTGPADDTGATGWRLATVDRYEARVLRAELTVAELQIVLAELDAELDDFAAAKPARGIN